MLRPRNGSIQHDTIDAMKFNAATTIPQGLDAYIVHVYQNEKGLSTPADKVDKQLQGAITRETKELKFKGGVGETLVLRTQSGKPAKKVIVVGVGKKPVKLDQIRQATAAAVRHARQSHFKTVATPATGGKRLGFDEVAGAVVTGAVLGVYHFDKYLNKEDKLPNITFTQVAPSANLRAVKQGITRAQVETDAVRLARDLVNEPPSEMTPSELARAAKKTAQQTGLSITVLDQPAVKRLGLNAYLAVSKGSQEPPKFIRLEYRPKGRPKRKVVLVGKSVTYDSGGINIKPSRGGMLEEMKMDMAGGAAVLGTMSALPKLGPPVHVIAYMAATENLLGGGAYKPGDILKSYTGKTIEVGNTDAEGRLTLADALAYAIKKDKPDEIVDLATLTGAAVVALGNDIAALFSNNDQLAGRLEKASKQSGERMWRLPLPEDYNELNKSAFADITNSGAAWAAGTITAALFLQNFVGKTKWAHIDIAGPAWADKDKGYLRRGGTGYGVRTLLEYLRA